MTPEQQARCEVLAKRVAELDPAWAKPGMATRYISQAALDKQGPKCTREPWQYRLLEDDRYRSCIAMSGRGSMMLITDTATREQTRELFAHTGPDYTDDCTLGALLLSLGNCAEVGQIAEADTMSWYAVGHSVGGETVTGNGDTRAEAILTAKVARLEQEVNDAK